MEKESKGKNKKRKDDVKEGQKKSERFQ